MNDSNAERMFEFMVELMIQTTHKDTTRVTMNLQQWHSIW